MSDRRELVAKIISHADGSDIWPAYLDDADTVLRALEPWLLPAGEVAPGIKLTRVEFLKSTGEASVYLTETTRREDGSVSRISGFSALGQGVGAAIRNALAMKP